MKIHRYTPPKPTEDEKLNLSTLLRAVRLKRDQAAPTRPAAPAKDK